MDTLQIELAKLRRDANLTQSIQDVDKIIEQLQKARESIVAGTDHSSIPSERRMTAHTLLLHAYSAFFLLW
jgi:hypothetical protein